MARWANDISTVVQSIGYEAPHRSHDWLCWTLAVHAQQQDPITPCRVSPANRSLCYFANDSKLTCVAQFAQTISELECALNNFTCQCKDTSCPNSSMSARKLHNAGLSWYVTFRISPASFLTNAVLSKFEANLCHLPIQDRSGLIVSVFITATTVTSVIVTARVSSKLLSSNAIALEDWIIDAALVNAPLLPHQPL
jgi:hypothetical protein